MKYFMVVWNRFKTNQNLDENTDLPMWFIISRAGHSLIFSRFAVPSPLNFFLWIADAHAFNFWISLFARRSNARRSTSGSLSEKGLNHSSLSINIWINFQQVTHTKEGDRKLRGINRSVLLYCLVGKFSFAILMRQYHERNIKLRLLASISNIYWSNDWLE